MTSDKFMLKKKFQRDIVKNTTKMSMTKTVNLLNKMKSNQSMTSGTRTAMKRRPNCTIKTRNFDDFSNLMDITRIKCATPLPYKMDP
jgi:hypothetical protein